jgi:acyl-coenzyme A thioesterase PaaI-like protein
LFREKVQAGFDRQDPMKTLGGRLTKIEAGSVEIELMDPDEEVVAAEFKINLLRPAVSARIVATANVIRAGRTLVISQAVVSAAIENQLVRVAMMLQTNCRVRNSG